MQKLLLLGDEAIAQAAIDAGMSGIYAYPGTPSTEITEFVQHSKEAKEKKIRCSWSANEKTSVESAIGMAYAGKRAMVCMKHVGLNVAADAFINSGITGTNGGLIVISADDPSMHSSQNEQDSRFYGKFSLIPTFEPANQQEAYDMVYEGFEFSEKYGLPILIRITTRMAHSRAAVVRRESKPQNEVHLPKNMRQYVLLPAIARKQYKTLLTAQINLENNAVNSKFNKLSITNKGKIGIITTGIAFNYLKECFSDSEIPYNYLKISQYPIPRKLVNELVSNSSEIIVLEEGFPMVEELLLGIMPTAIKIKGRLDGTLPRDGELNPNLVAKALNLPIPEIRTVSNLVVSRPPSLCTGCPHIDSFNALTEAINEYGKGRVFSDIGCYTLSALPPYEAINSCVDMGASITMAKGAADAGLVPSVAVIGDSTFSHSGITGLLDAVNENSPITVFILDNETTGMTGGQQSSATGKIENICIGLGVHPDHIRVLKPLRKNHEENLKVVKEELAYNGVSVIIPRRECIQTLNRRMRAKFKEKKNQ